MDLNNLDNQNNEARAFLKRPISFSNICKIYPPSINDILNNSDFYVYRGFLTITQEDLIDSHPDMKLTPFEYLLNVAYHSNDLQEKIKQGFDFFIHEEIHFLFSVKSILVGSQEKIQQATDLKDLKMIKEENYLDFQNLIRISLGEEAVIPYVEDSDPRIARMKAKMRERDRAKAKQASKEGTSLSLISTLASISCMGFGLNPLNIGELSYAAANTLIRFYQNKDRYEIDIRSLQAGADAKKVKPEYWIKNLSD